MSDKSNSNRTEILHIRVSDTELEQLKKAADAAGIPLTTWMRVLALNVARGGTWADVPTVSPKRWVRFDELFPGNVESLATRIVDPLVAHAVGRRGAYLVARFATPPKHEPSVLDPAVVYCGETHGAKASLRSRLLQFGRSAGLFPGGRRDGHYAAWSFADTDGVRIVPVDEVYVALLPVPDGVPRRGDLHGIWPLLAESALLWLRAESGESGRLPPLNSAGAQGVDPAEAGISYVREWEEQRDADDVAALFVDAPGPRKAAAQRLLVTLARGVWGYASRRVYFSEERDGAYARCHLATGAWLYVGWNAQGHAYVSVWTSDGCEFGEAPGQAPAADAEAFEALVRTLLTTYV